MARMDRLEPNDMKDMATAMIENHETQRLPTVLDGLFAILNNEDSRLWTMIIEARIIDRLLQIFCDKYFCGYTKQELTSWTEKPERYLKYIKVGI